MMNTFRNEYETARMEIVRFGAADVVRTSGGIATLDAADNDLNYHEAFDA